ncbi:hypothetical protein GOODEAATRI_006361, partial [Goodea atripinnis]
LKKWSLKHWVTVDLTRRILETFSPRIIMCRLFSWTSTSDSSFSRLSAPPAGANPTSSQKSQCNSWPPGAWEKRTGVMVPYRATVLSVDNTSPL